MKNNRLIQSYRFSFLLYLILGVVLLPFLRYFVDALDMVSYITVAQKYAAGNWAEAVNDLWSPLISWILAIPIVLKLDAFWAFKIVNFLTGFFTLYGIYFLLETISVNSFLKKIISFAFVPFVLSAALLNGAPDLLFLTIFLYYLKELSSGDYGIKSKGVEYGLWGAFLYFAKSYGFPFFIVHFTLVNGIYYFKKKGIEKRVVLQQFLKGLAFFFLFSGLWISALSLKNKQVTISGNGSYNFALIGRANTNRADCEICHPVHENGLHAPFTGTAINAGEEHNRLFIETWNPFSSKSNFTYYLRVIKTNILSVYYNDFKRQYGSVVLLAFILFLLLIRKFNELPFSLYLYALTLLIYNAGYILVHTNPRYLWINSILLVVLFLQLAPFFLTHLSQRILFYSMFTLLTLLLIKRPVKELLLLRDVDLTPTELSLTLLHPLNTLEAVIAPHKELFKIGQALSSQNQFKGNVANQYIAGGENYVKTSVICFYTGNKHFGELPPARIRDEGYKQLHDFNIAFYYSWNDVSDKDSTLISPPLFIDEISGLRIYQVRKK